MSYTEPCSLLTPGQCWWQPEGTGSQSCGWVVRPALGQGRWWGVAAALGLCFPTSPAATDSPKDGEWWCSLGAAVMLWAMGEPRGKHTATVLTAHWSLKEQSMCILPMEMPLQEPAGFCWYIFVLFCFTHWLCKQFCTSQVFLQAEVGRPHPWQWSQWGVVLQDQQCPFTALSTGQGRVGTGQAVCCCSPQLVSRSVAQQPPRPSGGRSRNAQKHRGTW